MCSTIASAWGLKTVSDRRFFKVADSKWLSVELSNCYRHLSNTRGQAKHFLKPYISLRPDLHLDSLELIAYFHSKNTALLGIIRWYINATENLWKCSVYNWDELQRQNNWEIEHLQTILHNSNNESLFFFSSYNRTRVRPRAHLLLILARPFCHSYTSSKKKSTFYYSQTTLQFPPCGDWLLAAAKMSTLFDIKNKNTRKKTVSAGNTTSNFFCIFPTSMNSRYRFANYIRLTLNITYSPLPKGSDEVSEKGVMWYREVYKR